MRFAQAEAVAKKIISEQHTGGVTCFEGNYLCLAAFG